MNARVVVVGLDDSPLAAEAFRRGIEEARGGTLHVVRALDGFDPLQQLEYAAVEHRIDLAPDQAVLKARIAELVAGQSAAELPEIVDHVLVGPAAKEIARVARSVDADLVIVGAHAQSTLRSLLLGSVAERLIREVGCSVLAIREKAWQ